MKFDIFNVEISDVEFVHPIHFNGRGSFNRCKISAFQIRYYPELDGVVVWDRPNKLTEVFVPFSNVKYMTLAPTTTGSPACDMVTAGSLPEAKVGKRRRKAVEQEAAA